MKLDNLIDKFLNFMGILFCALVVWYFLCKVGVNDKLASRLACGVIFLWIMRNMDRKEKERG